MALLFHFYAKSFAGIFSDGAEVVAVAALCLEIIAYGYPALAFGMVTVQAFNGARDTTTPTWINLFCSWIVQIPLAYVLSTLVGRPEGCLHHHRDRADNACGGGRALVPRRPSERAVDLECEAVASRVDIDRRAPHEADERHPAGVGELDAEARRSGDTRDDRDAGDQRLLHDLEA